MRNFLPIAALTTAIMALAACETQGERRGILVDNPLKDDGRVVNVAPTPMQLCSSSSLAEERETNEEIVNGAQRKAEIAGQTVLGQKLERYSADYDIAHRSMVRSCQLYANCMNQNGGQEAKCSDSYRRLNATERRYYGLIGQRDRLTAQIEMTRPNIVVIEDRGCESGGCRPPKGSCGSECATTANIFTDDCCE